MLERFIILIVTSDAVSSDDYDSASIGHDVHGGLVVNGGLVVDNCGEVFAGEVQGITIVMGGGSMSVDLSGVDGQFNGLNTINLVVADGSNAIYTTPWVASVSAASGASIYIGYGGGTPLTYVVGNGSGSIALYASVNDNTILDGGPSGTSNVIFGSSGNYLLNDGGGSNAIVDGGGYNVLNGAGGNNLIYTAGGTNLLNAGSGQNTIDARGDEVVCD